MTPPIAVFRADASTDIGTGHVVRCRTLAEALAARGWQAWLATGPLPPAVAEGWPGGAACVTRLSSHEAPDDQPREIARRMGRPVQLVVTDRYGLTEAWYAVARLANPEAVLMAIDDLAAAHPLVDLLVNQNLGVQPSAYHDVARRGGRVLVGPRFALVRPEFAALRAEGRPRDGRVERILVFLSGADRDDVTGRAVEALADLGHPIDIVVGSAYPALPGLRQRVARIAHAELHVDTPKMAQLMSAADLAIGAPGSASWERCTLGLPTLLVVLADNQVPVADALVAEGAAVSLGWHERVTAADIAAAVRSLSRAPSRVADLARRAATIADGLGVERVVGEVEALASGRMAPT